MARDSPMGRERALVVPGNITLEGSSLPPPVRDDINQQIMEVCVILFYLVFLGVINLEDEFFGK